MSGRKRENSVWSYFEYIESKRKSRCNVGDGKTGKECGQEICGKNPTNLKRHLMAHHKEAHSELDKVEGEKAAGKRKAQEGIQAISRPCRPLPIAEMVDKKTMVWPRDGREWNQWNQRKATYSRIVALAEDLVAAPASEAFVERIFSVAGMLSTGRRNRMSKSLEGRVFLKLNSKLY